MSAIPTAFDPLGTLGGGLVPYVQPNFTGIGVWDNTPSFPMEIKFYTPSTATEDDSYNFSYVSQPTTRYAWMSMSNVQPNLSGWLGISSTSIRAIVLRFEKPVLLESLALEISPVSFSGEQFGTNSFSIRDFATGTRITPSVTHTFAAAGEVAQIRFDLTTPTELTEVEIYHDSSSSNTASGRCSYVKNISVVGKYKP